MSWFQKKIAEYSRLAGYERPEPGEGTKLDSNENLVISRRLVDDLIHKAHGGTDVREYPLEGAQQLARAISRRLRVPASMVGVGNGADQILDLILANFASGKTKILLPEPTFGFVEQRCLLYSIPAIRVAFSDDMTLDMDRVRKAARGAEIIYLDTPNNPTGFQVPRGELEALVDGFGGPVIVDEAYGEFGDYTAASWARRHENLIVVRTFSKSFGLAGLRLGYFVASEEFTEVFNRVIQYPYPVNSIAVWAGIESLKNPGPARQAIEAIKRERKRVIAGLRGHKTFEVFDSKANFVLFDAGGADKRIYTALAEQGISIRRLGRIGRHEGCLRVTIGTKEMNSAFLLAMRDLLQ